MISGNRVREVLRYDSDSGHMFWLARPGSDRATNSWNAKHVGKRAGAVRSVGYRGVKVDGTVYAEHRLVWLLVYDEWPDIDLDHINGVRNDNRLANLRKATTPQNIQNQKVRRDNGTGLKGVQWRPDMNKYHARITVDGVRRTIGWYVTGEEAHAAYWAEAQKHFGEFARAH